MFKNSLKIIVLVGMLALSMVPAVASFSMQTPTVLTNHLKKSSLMSSLQFCRTTLRPDLLIRKHPVITLCVGLGFCAYGLAAYGLIRCYSGLSPDKNGKNSNNTGSKKTVFERFKTMNTINKIKTLFCPLLFMYSFIQPQVWTEFVDALNHITTTTEQIEKKIEEKKEPKKLKEEIKEKEIKLEEKKLEEEPIESWLKKLIKAITLYKEKNGSIDAIKLTWEEKINKNTKKNDIQKIKAHFPEGSLFPFTIFLFDFEQVKQLIDLGEDINEVIKEQTTGKFYTPLIFATDFNKIEIVNLLLEKGANPNTKNELNDTALHRATIKGNKEICRALFEHGADGNALGNSKQAPWQLAKANSYESWLKTLYPNKKEREKAIEKNKEALEKFKK